jgi:hypothetical protein
MHRAIIGIERNADCAVRPTERTAAASRVLYSLIRMMVYCRSNRGRRTVAIVRDMLPADDSRRLRLDGTTTAADS